MKSVSTQKRIVAAVLGVVITAGTGFLIRQNRSVIPSEVLRDAKEFSVKPEELFRFANIEKRLYENRPVTEAEWSFYRQKAASGELYFKRTAARHLGFTKGTRYESEALDIALRFVKSEDNLVRAGSVISLRKLNYPEWRVIALRLSKDADARVSRIAMAQLSKKP